MLRGDQPGHAADDEQKEWIRMKKSLEQLVGVKPPFSQAAFFEGVAGVIFLVALFWPHMSIANLLKGLLIGAVWAVYGFISYLKALSESPHR
ncbi:MAG: hypothetical protein C7B43_04030 [Sulfobacillus benefaciens]|uniref:Uncharacterized protein n=1 Tax=Sulfobacillus benefaciens TaxID=453960 RepID=A0A2T2X963_9FIRM|nr:MAG: hypothetical protein C7B43_04030 [Sulfobacillus benefaciens]HBQ96603.1 hypothetical protein [Sulfobacillus sp.]